jgi:hemoglobin/transferrin/lactoferrin receptor protein
MKLSHTLALLCLGLAVSAQSLRLLDAQDKTPVERGVLLSLKNNAYRISNDKGLVPADLLQKAALSDSFRVSCMGYETQTLTKAEMVIKNYTLYLVSQNLALDQVVISATRWHQSSRELPLRIKILKPREVTFQSPQTAADLLGQSGEVFIQKSQQGGGSPIIRGFATNRLLLAVDGVRMNNAIFRGGNLQNVIAVDPFAVERTEIYFGPGSVIYGSDAIGGVVSFKTLSAQLSSHDSLLVSGKANSRYASANQEFTGHFDVNLGWKKWAMRTSLTRFNFDDLTMGQNGPDAYLRSFYVQRIDSTDRVISNNEPLVQKFTGYQQTNLMQKIRFKPNSHLDFSYALHHSETSDYDRYDRLIRTRQGTPRAAEWYYGPQVWQMHLLETAYRKNMALADRLTLRTAYQYFKESRNTRDFKNPTLETRQEEVAAYSLNLDLLKRINPRHKLFYGAEAVLNEVTSRGSAQNINTGRRRRADDRYPQSLWQSYALYANHEWEIAEKITTQTGLRYNQFGLDADFTRNLDFFPFPFKEARLNKGALTGSAGVVLRPAENLKLRANFGTAFRAPNVDDIGKVFDSSSDDAVLVVPNPNLQAEYAYNAEIGAAFIANQKLKFDGSFYYTLLNNALVRRPFTLAGNDSMVYNGELSQVQAVQNAARATVWGLQLGFTWQLTDGLSFSSRFNYQEGQEELNNGRISPSRHAAPWFGVSRLNFENKAIRLQLYSQYSGAVRPGQLNFEEAAKAHLYLANAQGALYAPGWYTLNFKASYTFSSSLSLNAGLENITNQRYRPYSSGLVAPGRNFILGLQAQF